MARKALVDVTKLGVVRVMPLVETPDGWAVNDREVWHTVGEVEQVKIREKTEKGILLTRNRGRWLAYAAEADGVSRNYQQAIVDLLAFLGLEQGTLEDATPALF